MTKPGVIRALCYGRCLVWRAAQAFYAARALHALADAWVAVVAHFARAADADVQVFPGPHLRFARTAYAHLHFPGGQAACLDIARAADGGRELIRFATDLETAAAADIDGDTAAVDIACIDGARAAHIEAQPVAAQAGGVDAAGAAHADAFHMACLDHDGQRRLA